MLMLLNVSHVIYVIKSFSSNSKISTFYENVFNGIGCLTCYAFWLFY